MNKLEPICRALANVYMCGPGAHKDLHEDYISNNWVLFIREARAVLQALVEMADTPPVHLMASYAQSWLRFLLDEEKSLSQKMHEAGFTPRKQGKTVREDE